MAGFVKSNMYTMQSYYNHFENTHLTGSKFLLQWNPVCKDSEGTHHSVCIIQVFILSGLSENKQTNKQKKNQTKNVFDTRTEA